MTKPDPATLRRIAEHLKENENRWANHLPRKPLAGADAWLLVYMLENAAWDIEHQAQKAVAE